jgi:D-amino-acid dehydrogenase
MAGDHVIIAGAGHIGLACAYYLHQDGYDVSIIDQGRAGGACSEANCGFIVPSHVLPLTTPDALTTGLASMFQPSAAFRVKPQLRPALLRWMLQFARRCNRRDMLAAGRVLHELLVASAEEYRQLLVDPRLACEWREAGMLFVFREDKALEEFAKTDAMLTDEFGVAAQRIERESLQDFEPALLDDLAGAYFYESDSHLRPDKLNEAMVSLLKDQGVSIIEECSVESIEKQDGQVTALETSQGRMEADRFVFAAGAWSSMFADALECDIPIEPGKGYSVTMTCPTTMPNHPMLMPEKHIGVTPFEDGYRIASMMEFAGFDDSIPPFRIRQLQESAKPFLREPVGPEVKDTWYGWRPMTWDSLPIIGRVPAMPNAILATGHNMLGLSLAPITGKIVADLLGERPTLAAAEAVSPTRFA